MNSWVNREGIVFTIGDIITTYHRGYHKLTKIELRGAGISPLFYYDRILNSAMKQVKGKNYCDAAYCRHYSKQKLSNELSEIVRSYTEAMAILDKVQP